MTRGELLAALLCRGYNPLQKPYRQWLDESAGLVQFPLYDFRGQVAGYQTYRPGAPKHHTNPKMARYFTRAKRQLCWGTYLPLRPGPIYLTESIFKSAAIHRTGSNSWSVLGSDVSSGLRQQLQLLPYQFICVGDDDAAGRKFARTFRQGMISPRDLDEMTTYEIYTLLRQEIEHDQP